MHLPDVRAPGDRLLDRLGPRGCAVALLAVSLSIFAVVRILATPRLGDLRIYVAEGGTIGHGSSLYSPLSGVGGANATYPPFAACVFWPLTMLPFGLVGTLSVLVNAALVAYLAWTAFRMLDLDRHRALTSAIVLCAVALFCEPVVWTINYGQINLVLAALVLWDFTRRPTSRLRGVGVGLAAAVKLTPAVFVLYLLLTRRFRAAGTAVATFLAALGLSVLVDPSATRRFWTHDLFAVQRVGRVENAVNQTVRGMLARIDGSRTAPPMQLVLVLVVFVAGLACARYAYRHLGELAGVVAAAITGLLCSPISWSHHWVWCVPIAALVWCRFRWATLPTAAVFCSFAVWAVPHAIGAELHYTAWQVALSGWYVYFGVLALVVIAVAARRAARSAALPVTEQSRAEDDAATRPGVHHDVPVRTSGDAARARHGQPARPAQ